MKSADRKTKDLNDAIDDPTIDITSNIPVEPFDDIRRSRPNLAQKPLLVADFKGLTIDKLERYFLVLNALEENLHEYAEIKRDLEEIYNVVKNLNFGRNDATASESESTVSSVDQ